MSAARILLLCLLCQNLPCEAQQPVLILPTGHSKQVTSMAYSWDGKLIATAAEDNTIIIWDTRSARAIFRLSAHVAKINSIEFSRDDKYLVTGSDDKSAIIWEVSTGLLFQIILPQDNAVTVTSFSPDNKYVLTGCADGKVFMWSLEKKFIQYVLQEKRSDAVSSFLGKIGPVAVKAAEFSSDGTYLYVNFNDGVLYVYRTATGAKIYQGKTSAFSFILMNKKMAGFSPAGDKLVMLSDDGYMLLNLKDTAKKKYLESQQGSSFVNFKITSSGDSLIAFHQLGAFFSWDLRTATKPSVKELKTGSSFYYQAEFHNNSNVLITASGDSSIRTWNPATGQLLHQIKAGTVLQLRLDPRYDFYAVNELYAEVVIRNVKTGVASRHLGSHTSNINNAIIDPKNNRLWSASNDNRIRVWDLSTGRIEKVIEGIDKTDCTVSFSQSGKYFYTHYSNVVNIYDAEKATRLFSLGGGRPFNGKKGTFDLITSTEISPDEKLIAASSTDYSIRMWDLKAGRLISNLESGDQGIIKVKFSFDSKFIAGVNVLGNITIWNVANGTIADTLKAKPLGGSFFLSSTANLLCYENNEGVICVYNMDKKIEINAIKFPNDYGFQSAVFSNDNQGVLLCGQFISELWNISKPAKLLSIEQKEYSVLKAKFSWDDKQIALVSSEGKYHLYNAETGEETGSLQMGANTIVDIKSPIGNNFLAIGTETAHLYNFEKEYTILFTAIDKNGSIVTTDKGWHMSTTDAAQWVRWGYNNRVFDFDQWDIQYNRPDKVLELLGSGDTLLQTAYRKAYEKRLRQLRIDTLSFSNDYHIPELDITNAKEIEGYSKTEHVTLKIQYADPDNKNNIDKIFVTVNGCPIYSRHGLDVSAADSVMDIQVKLSNGVNAVSVSCVNDKVVESLRKTVYISYDPEITVSPRTYFIGIGIDQFADNKYNLQYSAKDIRDLSKKLKEKYKGDIIIDTLFNEKVTISNVKALKQKLQQTTGNDKVIIAYSGHGLLSKDYDYYLSTYPVNFDKPEQNGLPYEELESLLDSIPARKKLMLIDACHSGEVDKEDLTTLDASADSLIKGLKPVAYRQKGQIGLKNSFELMQSLFVNVGKSTGATIISAAAGTQFALERNDLKNGVFTYSILEAMNKYSTLKISELKKIVGERVEELTKGLQKPTSRNETIAVDWSIW